jgi:hypothetical protein
VAEKVIPFSALAALFFCGEKIEKSLAAWRRMAYTLLSSFPRAGFTNANGAALLALQRVFEEDYCHVQLTAFTWTDGSFEIEGSFSKVDSAFEAINTINQIDDRKNQFGIGLHSTPTFLFRLNADGQSIIAKVKGKDVELIKD